MHTTSTTAPPAQPRATWRTRLPFFYGWVVVASVFITLTIVYGVYYSFSVFYVALLEQYGWSRAATAGVFSVHILMIGAAGILAGRLIDRFGPSRVVPAGAVLLAAGLAATSQVTELWQFYLYFGVVGGLGVSISGWVPAVAMVSRWFSHRRGLAIGIASAGIGLGTVLMVPMNQYLISTLGWRQTYMILAGLTLFVAAPQALLLQVGRPADLGLKADGSVGAAVAEPVRKPRMTRRLVIVDQKWTSTSWNVGSALGTYRFWLLAVTMGVGSLTNQMLWAHEAAYLVDTGFEKMLAASMVGLAGFLSMPAKILWGMAADRIGRELTYTLGGFTILVAISLLVLVGIFPSIWLVLLFAIAFAFGYAVNAPLQPSAAADIFAGRQFGAIYGLLNMGTGFGGAFGAWVAGYVFDATGSYLVAFGMAATCAVIGMTGMWLSAPRRIRRVVRVDGT